MRGIIGLYNDNTDAFTVRGQDGRTYYALATDELIALGQNAKIVFDYKVINKGEYEYFLITKIKRTKKGHTLKKVFR